MPDFQLVKGTRLRLSKLDSCGAPTGQFIVTKGFISVGFTPTNEDGNTISQTNANGDICFREDDDPEFQNFGVEMVMCGIHPEVLTFLTGQPVVTDGAGHVTGIDIETQVDTGLASVAVELWSKVPGQQCVAGQVRNGYFLAPYVHAGGLSDISVQNDAINATITGARTLDGAAWGVGPYSDVDRRANGNLGPLLTPVSARNHLRVCTVAGIVPAPTDGIATGTPTPGNPVIIDNGDGTLSSTSFTDNGDGTITGNVTDNGDGTLSGAAA